MLIAIWAQDEQGIIGKENRLPWHLPNDLQFFKKMTEKNTIVMGRKTFESMGATLLPNRQTIILTTDDKYQVAGAKIMHSTEEVLAYVHSFSGTVFIAGGSVVYEEFLPYCDKLYRTLIHHRFSGDAFFPTVNWKEWQKTSVVPNEKSENNQYFHEFETYQRKAM